MKKLIVFFTVLTTAVVSQTGPWQSPLKICTSTNGTTFSTPSTFQDSSGVPSVIRLGSSTSDTLMAAFQWFPAPKFSTYWDKIAVKFSYDGGLTWTAPTSCTFTGIPVGYQRPFDPSLVQLPSGQIRMYFSDAVNSPPAGGIDTYSGISNDGITYTFESGAKFNDATKHAIDPSIIFFGSSYFYSSWTSNQTDGFHRAISNNGVTFTTQASVSFDGSHLWLGNYLVDGSTLKFYGSGVPGNIWFNSSNDGTTWTGYTNTNISSGGDPAVVKNKAGTYIMIYTGPPNITGIQEAESSNGIKLFPTAFTHHFNVLNQSGENLKIEVHDVAGKLVFASTYEKNISTVKVNLSHLAAGVYNCTILGESFQLTRKIIKSE